MKRKLLAWVLAIAALAVGSFILGRHLFVYAQSVQSLNLRPFTTQYSDYTVEASGRQRPLAMGTWHRVADGSSEIITTTLNADGSLDYTSRRFELADGTVATVFDALHTKTTGWHTADWLAQKKRGLSSPLPNCTHPNETYDGEENLFGYKADRNIVNFPDGMNREIWWRMADFSCAEVQMEGR